MGSAAKGTLKTLKTQTQKTQILKTETLRLTRNGAGRSEQTRELVHTSRCFSYWDSVLLSCSNSLRSPVSEVAKPVELLRAHTTTRNYYGQLLQMSRTCTCALEVAALVKDIGEESAWKDIPVRRCTISWVHDI